MNDRRMLGHISIGVTDLVHAQGFYDATLGALGYVRVWTEPDGFGYGEPDGNDQFAVFLRSGAKSPGEGFHLAFVANDRLAVDAFYSVGLYAGATGYGAPGLRTDFGPDYYACFLIDPFGYRLEAVHQ